MFDFLLLLSLVGVTAAFGWSLIALFSVRWSQLRMSFVYMMVSCWFSGLFYALKNQDTPGVNNLVFIAMLAFLSTGAYLLLFGWHKKTQTDHSLFEKPKRRMRLTDEGELEEVSSEAGTHKHLIER